jgi:hypothetical protein
VEERLQQAGLWESLPELVRASRCKMLAYHKLALETMRSLPGTSGYVLTGLKDTPISTAGILDERGEPKVALEEYLAFNADTVLLLDWHRRRDWVAGGDRPANPDPYNHFGGQVVYPAHLCVALRRTNRGREFCAGGWNPPMARVASSRARRQWGRFVQASRS